MTHKLSPSELYQAAVDQMPPEHIDHWCSDLYLKVTPTFRALLYKYQFKNLVHVFVDQIDHELWYDIPFAAPFRL